MSAPTDAAPTAAADQNGVCAICLDQLRAAGKAIFETPCGHKFHVECERRNVGHAHGTCPLCRHPIAADQRPSAIAPPAPAATIPAPGLAAVLNHLDEQIYVLESIGGRPELSKIKLPQLQRVCAKHGIGVVTVSRRTHRPVKKTKAELYRGIMKVPSAHSQQSR